MGKQSPAERAHHWPIRGNRWPIKWRHLPPKGCWPVRGRYLPASIGCWPIRGRYLRAPMGHCPSEISLLCQGLWLWGPPGELEWTRPLVDDTFPCVSLLWLLCVFSQTSSGVLTCGTAVIPMLALDWVGLVPSCRCVNGGSVSPAGTKE